MAGGASTDVAAVAAAAAIAAARGDSQEPELALRPVPAEEGGADSTCGAASTSFQPSPSLPPASSSADTFTPSSSLINASRSSRCESLSAAAILALSAS